MSECASLSRPVGKPSSTWIPQARNRPAGWQATKCRNLRKVFTKNRMNAFDLKAALLTKRAQRPVINPNTHGVKHGSNAWLTNSKLLASCVCARGGAISFFASPLLFSDNNKEY